LGSFYSDFHARLSRVFVNKIECAEYLIVDQGHRVYRDCLPLIDFSKVKKVPPSQESLKRVKELNFLSCREITEKDFMYAAQFRDFFKKLIQEKQYNLIIMHNDSRWNHKIVIDYCLENNIKYLVTERGGLRPFTTTIDPRGVNANASIPTDPKFYQT